MSKPPKIPTYRLHKQSGQAACTLTDPSGKRKDVLLGRYGSAESRTEYLRVVGAWEAAGRRLTSPGRADDLTVGELLAKYLEHAKVYYRLPSGEPSNEIDNIRYAMRPLRLLFEGSLVQAFTPQALQQLRETLIRGYTHPKYGPQKPLSRGTINARVKIVRRIFRWGVEQGIVEPAVLTGLEAVNPLKFGRSKALESRPVEPVARETVEKTLPLLLPTVRAMVELQMLTGARSGEICAMRTRDLHLVEEQGVLIYSPAQHKTAHHGHTRNIVIGPKGVAILEPFLAAVKDDPEAFVFSPRQSMQARAKVLRQARKTRVQPSQQNRRKVSPRRAPGACYTPGTFARAIARAIEKHNASRPEAERIEAWHPHQLRHLAAFELRRAFGLDVARACLGHASLELTQEYAGRDISQAIQAMKAKG